LPGTKNRTTQPPANARVRRAAHLERERRNHRKPSPERQARLHPSRADQTHQLDDMMRLEIADPSGIASITTHPLPWRAPDIREPGSGWHVVDATGRHVEYAKSRDKARARAKEVNGS
jgi:hypothetical protein